jgi:hypothetical protein
MTSLPRVVPAGVPVTRHRSALLFVLACLSCSWSCRIERETPTDPVPKREVRDSDAPSDEDEPEQPPNDEDPPPATSGDDAGSDEGSDVGGGPAAGAEAGVGGGVDSGAKPSADASASNCAPKVDGCNPVKNEGCLAELGMHCTVDPLAFTLAGYCIFSATQDGGTGCLNTFVTESCPPKSTCFEGQCQKLCFCNSDCDPGECCAEPLGSLGFKVCNKC